MKIVLTLFILMAIGCFDCPTSQPLPPTVQEQPKPTHAMKIDFTYDMKRKKYDLILYEYDNGKIIADGYFLALKSKEQADSIVNAELFRCNCPILK